MTTNRLRAWAKGFRKCAFIAAMCESQLAQAEQPRYAVRAKLARAGRQRKISVERLGRSRLYERRLCRSYKASILLPVNGQVGFQQEFTDNDVCVQHLLVCVVAMSIAVNGE